MVAGLTASMVVTLGIGSDARPTRSVELGSVPIAAASVGLAPPPPVADVSDWGLGAFRAQEAAEQAALRRDGIVAASRSAERPSLGWPAAGPLSGWYGERRGRRGHVGVDVDGDTGDPIVAAGAGVVEWAGPAPDGYSGYGLMVLIRHSDAVTTLYAHLSRIAVRAGEVVDRGDYIGAMGTTGNVTGSHLHFEVRLGGTPVNPRDWLPSR